MKKVIVLLIAILAVSGSVWGQSVLDLEKVLSFADDFNAMKPQSVENRYSAGRFTSDIDDYLDVNYHDPSIGTFVFLGGHPMGANVATNDTPFLEDINYQLSIGFAKSYNGLYLGGYYGGDLVNANGTSGKAGKAGKEVTSSEADWYNNLALIFGIRGIAFRFDLAGWGIHTENTDTYDGKITNRTADAGPNMALTFGINTLGALKPFVKVGYGFGATETKADPDGKNEATRDDGGKFLLQAGMNYELNETQAIYADLTLGMDFAGSYSGKAKDQFGAASDKQEIGDSYMGIVLYTHFDQTVNADKITVKFNPNISVAYLGYDKVNSEAKGDDKANLPSYSWFGIKTGVDLGVEYKHNEKFAFYTGAGLRLFQWGNMSGNPAKDVENGAWGFQGIQWDNGKWNGSTLGFGTVFTPSENLSIGAGLNTLIDRFVKIDLKAMNVSLGEFFEDTSSANAVDGLISRFDGIKFDITVSYKF